MNALTGWRIGSLRIEIVHFPIRAVAAQAVWPADGCEERQSLDNSHPPTFFEIEIARLGIMKRTREALIGVRGSRCICPARARERFLGI